MLPKKSTGADQPARPSGPPQMQNCRFCLKPFPLDQIGEHEVSCKSTEWKRKSLVDQNRQSGPNWRETDAAMIAKIREDKSLHQEAVAAEAREAGPAPPAPPGATVKCPHCGRTFAAEAGARHIPQCKDYDHNKPKKSRTSTK